MVDWHMPAVEVWLVVALALTLAETIDTGDTGAVVPMRRRLADAPWFLVYLVVSPVVGVVADSTIGLLDRSPALSRVPLAAQIPLALVAYDLVAYALHRLMHTTAWGWRLHRVHHASAHVSWWTAFRAHPVSALIVHTVPVATLAGLGFTRATITITVSVVLVVTLLGHAEVWLPPQLDRVVGTPRYHRRHHEVDHRDRNLALLFPAVDAIFGTGITSRVRSRSQRRSRSPHRSSPDSATSRSTVTD